MSTFSQPRGKFSNNFTVNLIVPFNNMQTLKLKAQLMVTFYSVVIITVMKI